MTQAQLFQFALLSHAHQIDNDPDARIDYDTSYLRPSSSQSELILVQRHKLTMGKENDISAHFSRFPREARVTTMRAPQRNKTADQPLAVCRMTGPMGAWSMQLSGCFNPDGLTSSPKPAAASSVHGTAWKFAVHGSEEDTNDLSCG